MKKNLFDLVKVEKPCDKKWEEMTGNSHQRFCSVCEKNVYNISAMTNSEARKLIKDLNGNLCVRYASTLQGKLITAPSKFTQITRRATIAAGVLATSLTFSTLIYGQTNSGNSSQSQTQSQQELYTLSGIVKDLQGNLVSNATIILKEAKTGVTTSTESNAEGEYKFLRVPESIYEMEIQSPDFKALNIKNIEVNKNIKLDNAFTETNIKIETTDFVTAGLPAININQEILIKDLPKPPKKNLKKPNRLKKPA